MGKGALEHEKTAATEPAKSKAELKHESPDKLGTLAATERSEIETTLQVVENSYIWFAKAATQKLDSKLRKDLHKEDEPHWVEAIASGLLELAISAGAAGAGAHLAKKVATKLGPKVGEGLTEFVKVMFEGGVNAGITAGRSKLGAGKDDDVVDPFIDAQIEGVDKAARASEKTFTKTGKRGIHTLAEAKALEDLCSDAHIAECADRQYEVSRDSWISYLAQTKFGAIGSKGAVQPSVTNPGATTTNMTDKQRRKETNSRAPGFVPEKGPDLKAAQSGDAKGVLVVAASLPSVVAGLQLTGRPQIHRSYLNGVNADIRSQYENHPLSSLHIPRQLVLVLEGEASTVGLGIDEKGDLGGVPRKGPLHDWLVARSTVAHPENASKSDFGKVLEGARLLLDDLVPTSIEK